MKTQISFILLAIGLNVCMAYGQAADAVVASISGSASFRKVENGKALPLKVKDKLYEENQVLCGSGCGELIIFVCKIPTPVKKGGWITITSSNCKSLEGIRTGRQKGKKAIIISPRESERVDPDDFVLRWKPSEPTIKFILILQILNGGDLWRSGPINGSKDFFDSDDLKKELKKAQETDELLLNIKLVEVGSQEDTISYEDPPSVKFKLLSSENQRSLYKNLKSFENENDDLIKSIKRGLAFAKYELFSKAASELEKAMEIASTRDTETLNAVTNLAIWANHQSYNDERVEMLCRSLKGNGHLPFPCIKGQ